MNSMAGRVDVSMAVGNEGAGVVVNSGSSPEAQALLGKAVATFSGGMYAQYRCVKAAQCVVLPPGVLPVDGASIFVNPLTALSMVDTMRREGHSALVHTAAASNLGQMLNRVCLQDNIELVNIVRSEAQVNLLRSIGSRHICNSSAPTFIADLTRDLIATGATLAFDAVGGGLLADQVLNCMEAAQANTGKGYSRYGSTIHKQVYIYGALDTGPTVLHRRCGVAFAVGGWLLTLHLDRIGTEAARTMQMRVLSELKTTFASHYTREIGLTEALRPEEIGAYSRRATGEKYLINPQKDSKEKH
jgi:NADPH2:quinone reductase